LGLDDFCACIRTHGNPFLGVRPGACKILTPGRRDV
jgi:hypothetical protein